jgi:uncharacterized protein GlcG (DUF336 family)
MRISMLMAAVVGGVMLIAGAVSAQQPAAPAPYPLDTVPDKMPFATPYGAPISLDHAKAAISAAMKEAVAKGWPMNITVVDSGGNLVAFERMDGAQLASIAISQHKARTAVKFRRPTKAFEEGIQKGGFNYLLTLDDVVASRGGIPLIEGGKMIGAIGCSGGTGSQDEVVCSAGAAYINK